MNKKPSILIIYSGGTIGMMNDPATGTLRPLDFEHITRQVPELARFDCHFSVHSFPSPIDSSNMKPETWASLARLIEKNYDAFDGFIILHGTDTMAFTASALSFMIDNLAKPVVLTGSQLPVGQIRNDARENLITAIEIASSKNHIVPEVCIFFDYSLLRGNRARKNHASKFEAFQSLNYPSLAEAGVHIIYHEQFIRKPGNGKLTVHTEMDPNVGLLKLYPGVTPQFVEAVLDTKGLRGIVLETFGAGNAPTDQWLMDIFKKAIDRGILILDITQCSGGAIEFGRYETSATLKKIGVLDGGDMTAEAALTKMMYLLGKKLPAEEIKKLLQTPLRGEMTT